MTYSKPLLVALLLGINLAVPGNTNAQPLPEGNTGIAARYPGDVGIASDSAVLFSDDFESYSSAGDLGSRWDDRYHQVSITTEAQNVFKGTRALQTSVPASSGSMSSSVGKYLNQEQDLLFMRVYSKFNEQYKASGSTHNGLTFMAKYMLNGQATPGIPADGYNKFLVSYEAQRGSSSIPSPGELNVYIYHPEQRSQWGDHFFPTGIIMPYTSQPHNFGPDFVPRPNVVPELGRWYSYELMVKANTPGSRDGRIALWLDGKLIADFPNIRLRDTDELKIDRIALNLYIGSNAGSVARKWWDNVVVATSYIGPMASRDPHAPSAPATPTGPRVVR
jgi:hypothetical protein